MAKEGQDGYRNSANTKITAWTKCSKITIIAKIPLMMTWLLEKELELPVPRATSLALEYGTSDEEFLEWPRPRTERPVMRAENRTPMAERQRS